MDAGGCGSLMPSREAARRASTLPLARSATLAQAGLKRLAATLRLDVFRRQAPPNAVRLRCRCTPIPGFDQAGKHPAGSVPAEHVVHGPRSPSPNRWAATRPPSQDAHRRIDGTRDGARNGDINHNRSLGSRRARFHRWDPPRPTGARAAAAAAVRHTVTSCPRAALG